MKPGILQRGSVLLMLGLFAAGLWRLFELRFDAGDVYPPGSTYRADPRGSRAFYEALELLPGYAVSRRLDPLHRLESGPGTTLFLLAVDPEVSGWLEPDESERVDRFVDAGGTLVVSLAEWNGAALAAWRTNGWGRGPVVRGRRLRSDGGAETGRRKSFQEQFGVGLELSPQALESAGGAGSSEAERVAGADPRLPATMSWPSAVTLVPGKDWTVVYECGGRPVVVERRRGGGRVVLMSDNAVLSNGGLRRERPSGFLGWLLGTSREAVFDETHLGVEFRPGVMSLIRRYRLLGWVVGVVVWTGLLAWRQGSRLVPPVSRVTEAGNAGRGSVGGRGPGFAPGLGGMLRRAVSPEALLEVCHREWRRSVPRDRGDLVRKSERLRALATAAAVQTGDRAAVVKGYEAMAAVVREREWRDGN